MGLFTVTEDANAWPSPEGGKATSAVCATVNADGKAVGSCIFSEESRHATRLDIRLTRHSSLSMGEVTSFFQDPG